MGGTYGTKALKDDANSATAKRTTLDYMVVAIPVGKLGVGFGLMPYSSVGYKIQSISADGSQNNRRLEGTGGVNKVFFGSGYKLTKNFSIGADVQYNLGFYRDWETDRKSTRLNSSHITRTRMPSSA